MTATKPLYMKSNLYYRILAVLVVASLLAACSAATKEDDKKARLEKLKTEQVELSKEIVKLEEEIAKENPDSANVKSKDVGVTELAPKKFDHYVQTQATVESENNLVISAKAAGTITQLFVSEGDQVSKGQTIAQIDNSIVARNIESMKSQLELATSVYERQKNLWAQKIGTEVQYLQTKTAKESLEKQIASVQEQNELTKIKSTINGTIDALMIKQGENVAPGMPAARVVNTADLKLTAKISEAYATRIKKGNKVLVNVSELNRDIPATVTFAGRTIDPLSRTFDVEVKLPSETDLRPNMTATAKVVFKTENEALVIPINVIQEINNEKVVYIAQAKGSQTIAVRKVVTVEGVYGGLAQVKGLSAGDKVITVGYQGLNDGDYVKI
jgi:membrane fusion protein, multidrug efflux system